MTRCFTLAKRFLASGVALAKKEKQLITDPYSVKGVNLHRRVLQEPADTRHDRRLPPFELVSPWLAPKSRVRSTQNVSKWIQRCVSEPVGSWPTKSVWWKTNCAIHSVQKSCLGRELLPTLLLVPVFLIGISALQRRFLGSPNGDDNLKRGRLENHVSKSVHKMVMFLWASHETRKKRRPLTH